MWNKKIVTIDQFFLMIIKTLNIIQQKDEIIILNEYMQNIHLSFDEVWKYLENVLWKSIIVVIY